MSLKIHSSLTFNATLMPFSEKVGRKCIIFSRVVKVGPVECVYMNTHKESTSMTYFSLRWLCHFKIQFKIHCSGFFPFLLNILKRNCKSMQAQRCKYMYVAYMSQPTDQLLKTLQYCYNNTIYVRFTHDSKCKAPRKRESKNKKQNGLAHSRFIV